MQHSCLERIHSIYLQKGDSLNALRYVLPFMKVSDSLANMNSEETVRRLEFVKTMELFQLTKTHEIQVLQKEEEKSRLITWITIVSSVLVVFVLIVVGRCFRRRYKQNLLVKQKELTRYTAEISSKNEVINNAIESLEERIISHGNDPELRSTLTDLKLELKSKDFWKDFEVRFRDVHHDFYKALLIKHPNLTKNEVRLCSFVKLKITTKETSGLTKKIGE